MACGSFSAGLGSFVPIESMNKPANFIEVLREYRPELATVVTMAKEALERANLTVKPSMIARREGVYPETFFLAVSKDSPPPLTIEFLTPIIRTVCDSMEGSQFNIELRPGYLNQFSVRPLFAPEQS